MKLNVSTGHQLCSAWQKDVDLITQDDYYINRTKLNKLKWHVIGVDCFDRTSMIRSYHTVFIFCKPGPPRFAQSTILVISQCHLPETILKKFIPKLLVTQYSCAECNTTVLLVINSLQSMWYITTMLHLMRAWNVFHCIILLRL